MRPFLSGCLTAATSIGRDGGELKASDFVKEWYKDEACSQPVTLEDMARIAPTDTQKFYLKVTYDAGAPTEESTGRTDGNIAGGDDHIVTAVNSDTKNYKDKEYGVYTVYVVDGQLTITKRLMSSTHILNRSTQIRVLFSKFRSMR